MTQFSISRIKLSHFRLLALLTIVVIIAGCAYAKAKGKVIEQKLIQPDEEIVILWDVGVYDNSIIQSKLVKDGVYSRRFEICLNEFLEKTFARNGYKVHARKKYQARLEDASTASSYVLILRNTRAEYSLRNPNDFVLLTEGTLYERQTGRRLWSVENWLANGADQNGNSALHLVRALAADGFLNVKLEQVVDYDGILSAQYRGVSKCPL